MSCFYYKPRKTFHFQRIFAMVSREIVQPNLNIKRSEWKVLIQKNSLKRMERNVFLQNQFLFANNPQNFGILIQMQIFLVKVNYTVYCISSFWNVNGSTIKVSWSQFFCIGFIFYEFAENPFFARVFRPNLTFFRSIQNVIEVAIRIGTLCRMCLRLCGRVSTNAGRCPYGTGREWQNCPGKFFNKLAIYRFKR
jgi:hypothetical protein